MKCDICNQETITWLEITNPNSIYFGKRVCVKCDLNKKSAPEEKCEYPGCQIGKRKNSSYCDFHVGLHKPMHLKYVNCYSCSLPTHPDAMLGGYCEHCRIRLAKERMERNLLKELKGDNMLAVEKDPHNKNPHEPGAKLDAGKTQTSLLLSFSRALMAVAEIGTYGANKYTRDGWQSVPDGINRYTDAMLRHLLYEGMGEKIDPESALTHMAHHAWNTLARLELMLREESLSKLKDKVYSGEIDPAAAGGEFTRTKILDQLIPSQKSLSPEIQQLLSPRQPPLQPLEPGMLQPMSHQSSPVPEEPLAPHSRFDTPLSG